MHGINGRVAALINDPIPGHIGAKKKKTTNAQSPKTTTTATLTQQTEFQAYKSC